MKLDYATNLVKDILVKRPDYILCGSTALMLAGKLPERKIGDLDFICPSHKFDPTGLALYGDYEPHVNDGYTCYKVSGDGEFYYNVFVHDPATVIQVQIEKDILMQSVDQILKWKEKYSRHKDLNDFIAIAAGTHDLDKSMVYFSNPNFPYDDIPF